MLSMVAVCIIISVIAYNNGVITGEWNVCSENGGVMLDTGECVNLQITDRGYRICKDVITNTQEFDYEDLNTEGLNVNI